MRRRGGSSLRFALVNTQLQSASPPDQALCSISFEALFTTHNYAAIDLDRVGLVGLSRLTKIAG
jgi:hypothetical protein